MVHLGGHENAGRRRMPDFTVEGLVKVDAGRWVIWTTHGSHVVKDFGHVGEGMLDYSTTIEADSASQAIAEFIGTYIPMSDDGPEVFDEVLIRSN